MYVYHLHDLQCALLAPWRLAAEATEVAFRNPFIPAAYTDVGRAIAAGAEIFERTTRPQNKPAFGLKTTKIIGQDVPITEETVLKTPFCNLVHFRRASENPDISDRIAFDPKVLIVAPVSGHHATLLRGTVEAMLPAHDVYVTDWIDAKQVPLSQGKFDLEDNITTVMDFTRFLGSKTHILAVCQASVAALCAVALLAESEDPAQPQSLTLIGGPIDVRRAPSLLSEAAAQHPLDWFRDTTIQSIPYYYAGAYRTVFPGFLQLRSFLAMNANRHLNEHYKLFQNLVRGNDEAAAATQAFYNEYLAVMDVPSEYYLQMIERVYQKADLPMGNFRWHTRTVRPEAIKRTALFTIEGELDDISPPGQTQAALALCKNLSPLMKRAHLEIGAGHYATFSGRRWRNNIQPLIASFIRENNKGVDDELPAYPPPSPSAE